MIIQMEGTELQQNNESYVYCTNEDLGKSRKNRYQLKTSQWDGSDAVTSEVTEPI